MDNWGCEFLDDHITRPLSINEPKPDWIYLPVKLLEQAVDGNRIAEIILNDQERLAFLRQDIKTFGLKEAGKLVISSQRIRLQDGNHRFIIAQEENWQLFPVTCEYTTGKIVNGAKLQDIFERFLRSFNAQESKNVPYPRNY